MNKSFPALVFIGGIVFVMAYVNLKDEIWFALLFAITQLFAGTVAALLILLRLARIVKNRGSFIYSLVSKVQLALLITDVGSLFDCNLVRRTVLAFLVLNMVLVICLRTDMSMRRGRRG